MISSTPLVSIIVPCYNQAHLLDETLRSVLSQTYANWECIIVNDGSPDNTEEIAEKWLKKDARFEYVFKENGGLSSARNFGIAKSNGNYILPLDSDDILHEGYLKTLLPILVGNQELGIVSCWKIFFKKDKSKIFYKHKPEGSTVADLMYENIMMSSSLYRKECWEQVCGYDENMNKGFEDWEFWINITKRGWKFKIEKEFLFYYRKSNNSMLTDTLKFHVEDNMEYVFNKHKEIYIKDFQTTVYYLLFLVRRHKTSEMKLKESVEYKLGKVLVKPFKIIKRILIR